MKFLLASVSGDGAGVAYRLQQEGNDVALFVKDKKYRSVLEGVVPHVTEEEGLKSNPDVIIHDMTGMGSIAEKQKKSGFKVVSGGKFNDVIEHDRDLAFDIAKTCGIAVPPFESFKGPDTSKAIEFVRKTKKRYVMKPDDDLGCALTYCARDAEDMIQELEYLGMEKTIKGNFLLQEFVEGVEISTEMWFHEGEPIPSLANSTMEVKKLMAGNKGPATGCEFCVVWAYESDEARIVKETIRKLYPLLKKVRYSGPLDINAIIDDKGKVWFLETTPRLGYSAIYAFSELVEGDLGKFFSDVANGGKPSLKGGIGTALTLSIPPYPYDCKKPEEKNIIFDPTQGKRILKVPSRHFWPTDMMEEDGGWVTAGNHGLVAYLSSFGSNLDSAVKAVYAAADKIEIPDLQYRVDGIDRPKEDIEKLETLGFESPERGEN